MSKEKDMSDSKNHELAGFEECSLFNSSHQYADNFNRAKCTCGWKAEPAFKRESFEQFKFHVERIAKGI